MKKYFVTGIVILLCFMGNTSDATMIIPPSTGQEYEMRWSDGLGQIDSIGSISRGTANTDWSITVSKPSFMSFIRVKDLPVPGDEFALYFDGQLTPWTSKSYDPSNLFQGEYTNLLLLPGTHTITFHVTKLVNGTYLSGMALACFSGVVPATAPVPEPATMLLLGSGLMGVAAVSRKNFFKK